MLLSRDAVYAATEKLTVDAFYTPAHGHIFEAILNIVDQQEPVDPVTVSDELRRMNVLDQIGGPATLLTLQTACPSTSNAASYADIVERCYQLRRLIGVASEIADLGYTTPNEAPVVLDRAETMIYDVARANAKSADFDMAEALSAALDDLERNQNRHGIITGTPSGFPELDEILGGFQPGTMTIIAARPSQGKSALALSLAHHAAIERQMPVLLFSLEMSNSELIQRLMSMDARVNSQRMRFGEMRDDDWQRIVQSVAHMKDAPIILDDSTDVTIGEIRGKARRAAQRFGGLSMVVVDYVQLMTGRQGAENRQLEVAEISRGLKLLSKEVNCPVVALAQLNRGVEQRMDKRPMLSDLRDSGSLEQDSDVVMFIYRDELYNPESPDRGTAEILIAKHRAGPIGMVRLAYLSHYTRFASMAQSV